MRLTGVGSQDLFAARDGNGDGFDGAKTYKVTLPKGIPAKAFWSFTLSDYQTRSMLKTPQKYPRAGSQSYPSPAAKTAEDGSTTVWFSPEQPDGVAARQLDPDRPADGLGGPAASLQPDAGVLRQVLTAHRDRTGRIDPAELAGRIPKQRANHRTNASRDMP